MEYEDVLRQYLGEFGRYQKLAAVLTVLVGPSVGATMFAQAFLAATPAHHCRLHQNDSSAMYGHPSERLNSSVPVEYVEGTWRYSSCLMYNRTGGTSAGNNQTITSCKHGWEYDKGVYHSTIVTEYNLVCERQWLKELGQSIFMVGVSAGGLISGTTSDRFGRRPTILACILLQLSAGLAAAFTKDYISFLVLRLVAGGAANGVYYVGFSLGMESIGSSKRNVVGMAISLSWAVGSIVLGSLAYFLRDWWSLQLALTVMSAPLLSYWWLLPESPRWLLSNNRAKESKLSIQKAAKMNKVTIPDDVYEQVTKPKDEEPGVKSKKYTLIDLIRGPRLRMITVTTSLVWFATVAVYYAMAIGSADLAGDPYLNFVLGALPGMVLSLVAVVAMEKWGRRPVVGGYLFLAGAACLAVTATPAERQDVIRYLFLLGRCAVTVAFNTLAVYTTEVFPTVVRTMGVGVSNMSSRVGGILSPLVSLLAVVWPPLPMLVFGILCTLGGAAVFSLPETVGIPLPDTLEDGENLGRKQKPKIDKAEKSGEFKCDRDLSYIGPVAVSGHVIWDNDLFYYT
ncbi:organic cation transporter protein-like [Branchiostoma lanceolatum]|uniref:organic cation transporter protein-like n=1 Tax=Branchiostoma lanceolatum TaxID=7740 RepID=UPI003453F05C